MSTSSMKKIRELRNLVEACGAVIESIRDGKGSHKVIVLRCGDKRAQTVISVSNNGSRNERNKEAGLRRLIRELSSGATT